MHLATLGTTYLAELVGTGAKLHCIEKDGGICVADGYNLAYNFHLIDTHCVTYLQSSLSLGLWLLGLGDFLGGLGNLFLGFLQLLPYLLGTFLLSLCLLDLPDGALDATVGFVNELLSLGGCITQILLFLAFQFAEQFPVFLYNLGQ